MSLPGGLLAFHTIFILNDYKDAERRSAEGDRKALCSPPQRRNPFAAYERDDLEANECHQDSGRGGIVSSGAAVGAGVGVASSSA